MPISNKFSGHTEMKSPQESAYNSPNLLENAKDNDREATASIRSTASSLTSKTFFANGSARPSVRGAYNSNNPGYRSWANLCAGL